MKQSKSRKTSVTMRLAAMGAALVLVLSMGGAALAETDAAVEPPQAEEMTIPTAAAALTDEQQQQALREARDTDDAAVDAALTEMVAAGALTQESVDNYRALREAESAVEQIDTASWTLDQISAYRQACAGNGVNETILAGLVSQGALTQAEVDTIKLAYAGDRVTLSDLMSQIDTSKATQAMITQLWSARKAYSQALADAGIAFGRGQGMPGEARGNNAGKSEKGQANDSFGNRGTNGKNSKR